MKKIFLLAIAADSRLNKFMQAADVFEEGKVLGQIEELVITYNDEDELTTDRAEKLVRAFENAEKKDIIVAFVHFIGFVEGDKIAYNDGTVKPYWNKSVRIISTGKKWYMLHEFVKKLGFKVETDEHMYITSIS